MRLIKMPKISTYYLFNFEYKATKHIWTKYLPLDKEFMKINSKIQIDKDPTKSGTSFPNTNKSIKIVDKVIISQSTINSIN
jgi:hypothetical protein